MDTKDLDKFDPTVAELNSMVEKTKELTVSDLEDKEQLAVVKENRIALKKARVQIEKRGKEMREDALAFQKAVIAKEKELIAIIEPEEDRLEAIEAEAVAQAVRKERLEKLPARKERMVVNGLAYFCQKTDEELLELDAVAFEAFYNELGTMKLEHDKAEEERKQREESERIEAENAKKQAEQDARDAELAERERKVKEEEQRIAHEKEVEEAKKATEARIKMEQEQEAERLEGERKANELRLKKDKEYQNFLMGLGMTKENMGDFHKEVSPTEITVYKKVGVFKK